MIQPQLLKSYLKKVKNTKEELKSKNSSMALRKNKNVLSSLKQTLKNKIKATLMNLNFLIVLQKWIKKKKIFLFQNIKSWKIGKRQWDKAIKGAKRKDRPQKFIRSKIVESLLKSKKKTKRILLKNHMRFLKRKLFQNQNIQRIQYCTLM